MLHDFELQPNEHEEDSCLRSGTVMVEAAACCKSHSCSYKIGQISDEDTMFEIQGGGRCEGIGV